MPFILYNNCCCFLMFFGFYFYMLSHLLDAFSNLIMLQRYVHHVIVL
jgi:hypothetical protein